MRTESRGINLENVGRAWDRLDNLVAMTGALIDVVNQELLDRYEHKEGFYMIEDSILSDVLWQIKDNFVELKAVSNAIPRHGDEKLEEPKTLKSSDAGRAKA